MLCMYICTVAAETYPTLLLNVHMPANTVPLLQMIYGNWVGLACRASSDQQPGKFSRYEIPTNLYQHRLLHMPCTPGRGYVLNLNNVIGQESDLSICENMENSCPDLFKWFNLLKHFWFRSHNTLNLSMLRSCVQVCLCNIYLSKGNLVLHLAPWLPELMNKCWVSQPSHRVDWCRFHV